MKKSRKPAIKRTAPEICPVCGEDVPRVAKACPECGADERSGWKAGVGEYDGTGTEEDDFSYNEFVEEEFGRSPKPAGISPIWWITAILLLIALVVIYVRGSH